jgi:hypothetical protein
MAVKSSLNSFICKCSIGRAGRFTQTKTEQKQAESGLFFSPLSFYSDSLQNMGLNIENFALCQLGEGVGVDRYIQVVYVLTNVVLAWESK